jgi:hypothetical protein
MLLLWRSGSAARVAVYPRARGRRLCDMSFPVDGRNLQYDRCGAVLA